MAGATTEQIEQINQTIENALRVGTKLLSQQEGQLFDQALEDTQEQNRNLKYRFHKYLTSFDNNKKKQYYKFINQHGGEKQLAIMLNEYNKIKEETKTAITINNLLRSIDSNGLSENKYYKLKNLDVVNKLDDIKGSKLTNRRKAFYQNDYIDLARYYKSRFRGVYFLLALVYLALMFKRKKYKEYKYWGIFAGIMIYPFVINNIMLKVISIIEQIFRYTPVNTYRDLYSQDINKSTDNDNKIFVHYTNVRERDVPSDSLDYHVSNE